MSEGNSSLFTLLQDSFRKMEEQLTTVCADVVQLKRNQPPQRAAQLPGDQQLSGASVQSTPTTPDPPVEGEDDDGDVITKPLLWEEQMELLENQQNPSPLDTLGKRPKGRPNMSSGLGSETFCQKLSLTKVDKETEDFLHEAFSTMENEDRKDLRRQFIVPDTPFTMAPYLDKVMAAECSKGTKATDQAHSKIQALFLDAVGPLTQLLDGINKGQKLVIEDVEAAVKAALSLMGNASSHCTALRRTNVLEEYNKDLVSFGQDSELFTSATTTLFGPSFHEKAVEHLKQLQTLRQAQSAPKPVNNQNFPKAPSRYTQRGGKANYFLQRRQASQPYPRGGYSNSRGKGAMSTHHPRGK